MTHTEPEAQHISILKFVDENDSVTEQDLIEYGKREELPFIARYDTAEMKNPDRGYYRRLDSRIITPLRERGLINVEKHSKYQYVSVTESGFNQLQASAIFSDPPRLPDIGVLITG